MRYLVNYCIPYEGDVNCYFKTVEEVKEFIKSKHMTLSYDDFEVMEVKDINIYSLMKDS
jgi:hypothetical protein